MNPILQDIQIWTGKTTGLFGRGDAEIWSPVGKVIEILRVTRKKAIIRTPQFVWNIERGNVFTREYSIFDVETGDEIAVIEGRRLKQYQLTFRESANQHLYFRKRWKEILRNEYVWEDEKGAVYARFSIPFNPFSRQFEITMDLGRTSEKDALLMCGIGAYLLRHLRKHK